MSKSKRNARGPAEYREHKPQRSPRHLRPGGDLFLSRPESRHDCNVPVVQVALAVYRKAAR